MRKTLILISIPLLLLTACTFFEKKEEAPAPAPAESQLEKKIGLVSTSADQDFLTAPSQYILLTDAGERVFVESVSVNLKRYVKRRIEAEGKWNDARTTFQVNAAVSLGNELQVKETYMSTEMGLKFQYPSVWILKEEKNVAGLQKIVITPYEASDAEMAGIDNIVIERSENNRRESPREWLNLDEQYRAKDPLDTNNVYQQSTIGAAQLAAVKKTIGSGEKIEFYAARDTYIYRFEHTTMNDSDKDLYRNAFFNLVASFEFVPFGKQAEAAAPKASSASQPKAADVKAETPSPALSAPLAELAAPELERRKQEEEAAAKQKSLTDSRNLFINYLKEHISDFAPEPASLGGTWFVEYVEFVFPEGQPENFSAIYAVYEDGHDLRKILLNVPDRSAPEKMARAAYFKPGSVSDWQISDGADTVKDMDKAKVGVASGGSEIVIKKGMSLLEARSFKIKIQYPANWYWAFESGSYLFSNKPVTGPGENILATLTKEPSVPPDNSVCVQGKAKYCIAGTSETMAIAKTMLETLQEE